MKVMVRKKKAKRFHAVQAVKELARERMGAPPAEKVAIAVTPPDFPSLTNDAQAIRPLCP